MAASMVEAMMIKSSNKRSLKLLHNKHENTRQPSHTCTTRGNHTRKKDNNDNNNSSENNDTPQSPCFSLSPPSTNSDEISELWARVRSSTQQDQMPQPNPKVAGKGTNDYRIRELEPRRITIVETGTQSMLPHTPAAPQPELEDLYVPVEDDQFINKVRKWVKWCSSVNSPALPEFQWTTDVYLLFFRKRDEAPDEDEKEETTKLERSLQPWVSLKQNEDILLPPKEVLLADDSLPSLRSGKRDAKKRKRVSVLPDEILMDGTSRKDTDSASKGQQTGMRPDIMYASSISRHVDPIGMYRIYPAMRTFMAINQLPPYIIGEFKSTLGQVFEAQQSLALVGAMMLLERVKLRRMSPNPALDDIKLFMVTCCAMQVDIYCMVIRTTGDRCQAGELLSYDMYLCSTYFLSEKSDIKLFGETLNQIHVYGQTTHLDGIKRDLSAAAAAGSVPADLDKCSYQYNGPNKFDQGVGLMNGVD